MTWEDRSGNTRYTPRERLSALGIGCLLLAIRHLLLDPHLTYWSGLPELIFGLVTMFAFWIAVVGATHNDPD